jgi:hypothetical protein
MGITISVNNRTSFSALNLAKEVSSKLLNKTLQIAKLALRIIRLIGSAIYESCLSLYYYLELDIDDDFPDHLINTNEKFIEFSIHTYKKYLSPKERKKFDEDLLELDPLFFVVLSRIVCKIFVLQRKSYTPDYIEMQLPEKINPLKDLKAKVLQFTPLEKEELHNWDPHTVVKGKSRVSDVIKHITANASYMLQTSSFNQSLRNLYKELL